MVPVTDCLNNLRYDRMLQTEINSYPVQTDGYDQGRSQMPLDEHPCLALRKLLGDGTFYFSGEFDLTNRMQDRYGILLKRVYVILILYSCRSMDSQTLDVTNFDTSFMWNSHMINPLLQFRSRLSRSERYILDDSRILTCVIRGFVESMTIPRPATKMESATRQTGLPAYLTLISRLSCRRAGTRFNARGIDDDGNVANFVETETIIWNPGFQPDGYAIGFSYTQVRGSVPVFWEQQSTLLPGKQATTITRSEAATQPAFDKHMEALVSKYGAAHVVNLLSELKTSEVELSQHYRHHIRRSPLYVGQDPGDNKMVAALLRSTEYDFHTETKAGGYDEAKQIRRFVSQSADSFDYFCMEDDSQHTEKQPTDAPQVIRQQQGVFRTNCLDCLDRTNLIQGIFSRMAIEMFLEDRQEFVGHEFWMRHQTLWADNGDVSSVVFHSLQYMLIIRRLSPKFTRALVLSSQVSLVLAR